MLFYQVGEFFQSLAVKRSRKSISDLMDIRPDSATAVSYTHLDVYKRQDWHRYLKRAKLRYGNAVTADILW